MIAIMSELMGASIRLSNESATLPGIKKAFFLFEVNFIF